uniref:Putative secreted peptide n=2 Tax=Nyssorhynchus TaxID=44543 RepID=A0A2M3ZEM2_9DIPT
MCMGLCVFCAGVCGLFGEILSIEWCESDDCIEQLEPKVIIMDDGLTRYVCPQCGVKYKKLSALRGHMKECGKGAQCPLCPKIVTQRRNLPKHMERHRRDGLMEFHHFIDNLPMMNMTM